MPVPGLSKIHIKGVDIALFYAQGIVSNGEHCSCLVRLGARTKDLTNQVAGVYLVKLLKNNLHQADGGV